MSYRCADCDWRGSFAVEHMEKADHDNILSYCEYHVRWEPMSTPDAHCHICGIPGGH